MPTHSWSKMVLKVLDHSSVTALMADLGRHRYSVLQYEFFDPLYNTTKSPRWRLVGAGPSILIADGIQIVSRCVNSHGADDDPFGNVAGDFHLHNGRLWPFNCDGDAAMSRRVVVTGCLDPIKLADQRRDKGLADVFG